MNDIYITVEKKHQIMIRDIKNGRILSNNYIPEEIVHASLQGDQIVVQTDKSTIVLKRVGRYHPSFSVYSRRGNGFGK